MKQDEFDRIDRIAAHIGGDAGAAEFCGAVGKTDIAAMTEQERQELYRRIVAGYRNELKARLEGAEPPF